WWRDSGQRQRLGFDDGMAGAENPLERAFAVHRFKDHIYAVAGHGGLRTFRDRNQTSVIPADDLVYLSLIVVSDLKLVRSVLEAAFGIFIDSVCRLRVDPMDDVVLEGDDRNAGID